jgi:hypothetical protein
MTKKQGKFCSLCGSDEQAEYSVFGRKKLPGKTD